MVSSKDGEPIRKINFKNWAIADRLRHPVSQSESAAKEIS
jgi:hypothetical protein